ncbi:MAG: dihydroxyacetone kinase family protein, partial [Dermatophilaceae bacterium]
MSQTFPLAVESIRSNAVTTILNDPADFTEDMLAGFFRAHEDVVQPLPGGVIRATATRPGKVAVVIGGGSGHYPAFAGWVGIGLADAAVVGPVFASPSAQQIVSVAAAADDGAGVLLSFGNYAGDVLSFGAARTELAARGLRTRSVVVSDDIASAPRAERSSRRGAAGDLVVVKVAGAAAEAGYDLDEVARVADEANTRTASLGIAFSGCTLPGASAPLFTLPPGRMGVGLGVHGEPGIAEADLGTAADVAAMLVARVLEERPRGATRAAVLLNGMGSTTPEELFIVWNEVAGRLEAQGVALVEPEVGELITSLDMAGLSLTVTWLNEELEALWRAPARGAAYRKGNVPEAAPARRQPTPTPMAAIPRSSPESRHVAALLTQAVEAAAQALRTHQDELDVLDSVAGNGDHGRVMARGARAAASAAERALAEGAGAATLL